MFALKAADTVVSLGSLPVDEDRGFFFGGSGIGATEEQLFASATTVVLDAAEHFVRLTTSTPPPQQAHSYNSVIEYISLLACDPPRLKDL